jgi:hypothetical protein
MQSGGGTRDVSMNVDANAEDIIQEAKKLFYLNEKSVSWNSLKNEATIWEL